MNDIPLVRLSRDRRWAVCSNVDCGERFARRIDISAMAKYAVVPESVRPPVAALDFLPGWTHDEVDETADGSAPGGV